MLNQLNIVTYLNQSICFTLQLNCPSSGRFQNVQIFSPSSHMSTYYITPLRKFFSFVLQFIHRLAFKKKKEKSLHTHFCVVNACSDCETAMDHAMHALCVHQATKLHARGIADPTDL